MCRLHKTAIVCCFIYKRPLTFNTQKNVTYNFTDLYRFVNRSLKLVQASPYLQIYCKTSPKILKRDTAQSYFCNKQNLLNIQLLLHYKEMFYLTIISHLIIWLFWLFLKCCYPLTHWLLYSHRGNISENKHKKSIIKNMIQAFDEPLSVWMECTSLFQQFLTT